LKPGDFGPLVQVETNNNLTGGSLMDPNDLSNYDRDEVEAVFLDR